MTIQPAALTRQGRVVHFQGGADLAGQVGEDRLELRQGFIACDEAGLRLHLAPQAVESRALFLAERLPSLLARKQIFVQAGKLLLQPCSRRVGFGARVGFPIGAHIIVSAQGLTEGARRLVQRRWEL